MSDSEEPVGRGARRTARVPGAPAAGVPEAPEVRLEPTTAADFGALRELFDDPSFAGWGGPGRLPDDVIRQKYLGPRLPEVESFLVLRESRVVGLALCHGTEGGEHGGLDLILLPAVRGTGVGSRVVAELVDHAREGRGWRRVTVDPVISNIDGIRFWRSRGFEPVRRVPETGDREPYLLMVRELP